MKNIVVGLIVCIAACFTTQANAQLTLTIDTVNDTFALTGSDTGEATAGVFGLDIAWRATLPSLSNFWDASFDDGLTIVGQPTPIAGNNLAYRPTMGGVDGFAEFTLNHDVTGTHTIVADGTTSSYATATVQEADIESLIGQTLELTIGTGFSPIRVVGATSVPEPSSAGLLGTLVAFGLLSRRRR